MSDRQSWKRVYSHSLIPRERAYVRIGDVYISVDAEDLDRPVPFTHTNSSGTVITVDANYRLSYRLSYKGRGPPVVMYILHTHSSYHKLIRDGYVFVGYRVEKL